MASVCIFPFYSDGIDNISDRYHDIFLHFPSRMSYPVSHNLSIGFFLIIVNLSSSDAVLLDIGIKNKQKRKN